MLRSMNKSQEYPTISVVVPSFNQASYLPQALDSILLQSYPRLELIVIDGGSTDGSVEILQVVQRPADTLDLRARSRSDRRHQPGLCHGRG